MPTQPTNPGERPGGPRWTWLTVDELRGLSHAPRRPVEAGGADAGSLVEAPDYGFDWRPPPPHDDAGGFYAGVNAPVWGPVVAGLTAGPSARHGVDLYGQVGVGAPGPFAGYTPSANATLEGGSGAWTGGRPGRVGARAGWAPMSRSRPAAAALASPRWRRPTSPGAMAA